MTFETFFHNVVSYVALLCSSLNTLPSFFEFRTSGIIFIFPIDRFCNDYILHIYITDLIAFAHFIFFTSFAFNIYFHFKLMVELAPFFTFFFS